jgi:hypothetical protein
MDAFLNPDYLYLPRAALFGLSINLYEETEQMLLFHDLFAGGVAGAQSEVGVLFCFSMSVTFP